MTKQLILKIIKDCVPCGTDKGSTQGVIDTRDFYKAADKIFEVLNMEKKSEEELEKKVNNFSLNTPNDKWESAAIKANTCNSCGKFKSECSCF